MLLEVIDYDQKALTLLTSKKIKVVIHVFRKVINVLIDGELISLTNSDVPRAGRFIRLKYDKPLSSCFSNNSKITCIDNKIYIDQCLLDFSNSQVYQGQFNKLVYNHPSLNDLTSCLLEDKDMCGCINYVRLKNGVDISSKNIIDQYLAKNIDDFINSIINKENKPIKLLGLGYGLTPSGDDFLYGFLLTMTLFNRKREMLIVKRYIISKMDTTSIVSKQMFTNLFDGKFNELYYKTIMMINDCDNLKMIYKKMKKVGHSSGIDFIVGVWAAFIVMERE